MGVRSWMERGCRPRDGAPKYVLDSGVFYCLTWVDTESAARQDDNLSLWRPPDRPSPVVYVRVHSGVDAPHRLANAMVPSRGHDSSPIAKTRKRGRQWQTTFLSLRTTAPESLPSPNTV